MKIQIIIKLMVQKKVMQKRQIKIIEIIKMIILMKKQKIKIMATKQKKLIKEKIIK